MKKNEVIELNGVEYTLELNRDSFLKIDQYCNIKKSMEIVQKDLYNYIDEIKEDENPFADVLDDSEIEKSINDKVDTLHKVIERAFWIWLYPNHKLSIKEVKEILKPYFEDEEKLNFIGEKYGEYLQECVQVREDYLQEQKNLKAQANK